MEIWKDINNYEGLYQVSNFGRVKSLSRQVEGRRGLIQEKILKPTRGKYQQVSLSKNGKQEYPLVHRLVLESFVGECPDGMECCHKDHNPQNNNLDNLEWGTHFHNLQQSNKDGRYKKGEQHHKSRLDNNQVREIKSLLKQGISQRKIAKQFNISQSTIGRISTKQIWKDI